jgi:Ti-type conjugative transfer relaxase TraA
VSILFGVGGEDLVREVRAAHEVAVADALGYLERNACGARRGAGGCVAVQGKGFVAAAFEHRSSRAGDPLLHTHLVVANMTEGPDGRWTALDGRLLYRQAKTAGYLYQAALRSEIRRRLGLEFGPVENGTADLRGVPRPVIEHFSQRRAEIVELMAVRGERSARAAQIATLETRRRKDYGVPVDRLREEWRARAAEHGFDAAALDATVSRDRPTATNAIENAELADTLTRDASSFSRLDVIQVIAATGVELDARSIESRADTFLSDPEVIRLEARDAEPRYTTIEVLRLEQGLLDGATSRKESAAGFADPDHVRTTLAAHPVLSSEQSELVRRLTHSGDGVQVVRAAAGTGKTTALAAAHEAWKRSGVRVIGCALSARAACELRDQAGIDSTTIARLKLGFEQGLALKAHMVLVVDEAGMVGTRDLVALAEATARAGAKLVLVGDDHQLPEIEAGGAFAGLADRLGAVELHEVRRQAEAWDREALAHLRTGDLETFTRAYVERGRVVTAANPDQARARLVADWMTTQTRGDRTLMIAHRRADVADLNGRARDSLKAAGRLGSDELHTQHASFASGDRVVTTSNDRRIGAVNGQTGTLLEVGQDEVVIALDVGGNLQLPLRYVQAGSLAHAYAVTAHRAQGATVDRAFVLGSDELYREWGYTALSRHRVEARFYLAASPTFLNEPARPLATHESVADRIGSMLGASRAQTLASNGLDTGERRAEIDARLAELRHERRRTGPLRRNRRSELDARIAATRRELDELETRTARLTVLRPAVDPLAALDATRAPARGRGVER